MSEKSSFIEEILKQTKEAETPRAWLYWAGLAAISGIVSPNVYLDKFYYKLSPNVYILLVGKSGLGKGLPIHIAKTLVEKSNVTRVIHGRNSIQSIVTELSKTRSVEGGGFTIKDSRAYLSSGEFVNFVIDDPHALTILTEWYDTHYMGEWKNSLKGSGVERLRGVNICLFGAASPAHLREKIKTADIEGGFMGRTLVIYQEKRARINPLTSAPEELLNFNKLYPFVEMLSKVKGQFAYSESGREVFNEWYKEFRKEDKDDKTGQDQRMQDHVLKVAMLISLSKLQSHEQSLILTGEDVSEAIRVSLELQSNSKKALLGEGKSSLAYQTTLLLNDMLKAGTSNNGHGKYEITRPQVLMKHWGDITASDLDMIEITLEQAGAINIMNGGPERTYELTDKFLNSYNAKMENAKNKES